jgi:hypothetical protein
MSNLAFSGAGNDSALFLLCYNDTCSFTWTGKISVNIGKLFSKFQVRSILTRTFLNAKHATLLAHCAAVLNAPLLVIAITTAN